MSKKMMFVAVVLLAAGTAVFAGGARENAPAGADPRYSRYLDSETVSKTGTLDVSDAGVILEASDGTFSLSAPMNRLFPISGYDGALVSVSGVLTECDECPQDYDGHIFVASAEADGKTLTFEQMGRWNQDTAGKGRAAEADQFRRSPVQNFDPRRGASRMMPQGNNRFQPQQRGGAWMDQGAMGRRGAI